MTTWQFTSVVEVDSYKRGQGVESRYAIKQLQIVVRRGLEPRSSRFQVRQPNPSATLPPIITSMIPTYTLVLPPNIV